MANYTAQQIADWFLTYDKTMQAEQASDGISNLKLQKLLYYAQSAYLATHNGEPLFDEAIVAWMHGPVVPSVYYKYKDYGSTSINADPEFDTSLISEEDTAFLEQVYELFGQFSAWKLRNMTHAEDPWKKTANNCEISRKLMQESFEKTYME